MHHIYSPSVSNIPYYETVFNCYCPIKREFLTYCGKRAPGWFPPVFSLANSYNTGHAGTLFRVQIFPQKQQGAEIFSAPCWQHFFRFSATSAFGIIPGSPGMHIHFQLHLQRHRLLHFLLQQPAYPVCLLGRGFYQQFIVHLQNELCL